MESIRRAYTEIDLLEKPPKTSALVLEENAPLWFWLCWNSPPFPIFIFANLWIFKELFPNWKTSIAFAVFLSVYSRHRQTTIYLTMRSFITCFSWILQGLLLFSHNVFSPIRTVRVHTKKKFLFLKVSFSSVFQKCFSSIRSTKHSQFTCDRKVARLKWTGVEWWKKYMEKWIFVQFIFICFFRNFLTARCLLSLGKTLKLQLPKKQRTSHR